MIWTSKYNVFKYKVRCMFWFCWDWISHFTFDSIPFVEKLENLLAHIFYLIPNLKCYCFSHREYFTWEMKLIWQTNLLILSSLWITVENDNTRCIKHLLFNNTHYNLYQDTAIIKIFLIIIIEYLLILNFK